MVASMKDVDDHGPTVELLTGEVGTWRELSFVGGDGLGVLKVDGGTGLHGSGPADEARGGMGFSVAFAHNGKGGEALREDQACAGRDEVTEDLADNLGGSQRGVRGSQWHGGGLSTLTKQVPKQGIVGAPAWGLGQ